MVSWSLSPSTTPRSSRPARARGATPMFRSNALRLPHDIAAEGLPVNLCIGVTLQPEKHAAIRDRSLHGSGAARPHGESGARPMRGGHEGNATEARNLPGGRGSPFMWAKRPTTGACSRTAWRPKPESSGLVAVHRLRTTAEHKHRAEGRTAPARPRVGSNHDDSKRIIVA